MTTGMGYVCGYGMDKTMGIGWSKVGMGWSKMGMGWDQWVCGRGMWVWGGICGC